MARKIGKGTRVILATGGVVVGLAVGIVVVVLIGAGGGGDGEAQPYQPFFVGTTDRVTKQLKDGPVCYQDPKSGERSFCLDREGDQFIAVHVVPPGGTAACLVQWDRNDQRYEDCHGAPVDRNTLSRFPVLTREISKKISVFVDVRTPTPPAG